MDKYKMRVGGGVVMGTAGVKVTIVRVAAAAAAAALIMTASCRTASHLQDLLAMQLLLQLLLLLLQIGGN